MRNISKRTKDSTALNVKKGLYAKNTDHPGKRNALAAQLITKYMKSTHSADRRIAFAIL